MSSAPLQLLASSHLRIARPTDRLEESADFYCTVLGFNELFRFKDHDGFDGVMLGHDSSGYHLELTHAHGESVGRAPNQECLLVFYVPDFRDWRSVVDCIESHGVEPVKSFNPYWDRDGRTYEDPDGYRIVIQNASWGG